MFGKHQKCYKEILKLLRLSLEYNDQFHVFLLRYSHSLGSYHCIENINVLPLNFSFFVKFAKSLFWETSPY